MAKQLTVNLAFTADTTAARQQLAQLKTELTNLTTSATALTGGKQLGITNELSKAAAQAAQLRVQLESATNVNTGRLDLTKFNSQLQQSGMNITQYRNALQQLGPAGQQAFQQLATAVSHAETPIFRASTALSKLGQTLKNTVRWQISSSLITGFVGAIQTAYNYSKDLNESLNNIRIVTGKTVAEMDKFAARANAAAKALSTSTLEYTKASLIYYQQGIKSQQEIEARTNTTIKLANVTGESAETVSEWMTAIWNNYDNGTRSLENYADVLAKLGAETASSADEIATGMEKFAAIGETVGLSYNNAAAALATITATTRQSADVVGTALKTLFSRMEQLKLGETLDDGTTLGKYSEALKIAGVNIKDANGQLKDMDDIIDETGRKWQTLNRDQQVALAQSVAGIRQYAQFMALMDNYDMYGNLVNSAENATGALQEQQKIYEESWRAASDRVKASFEKIYAALLDDKFFISFTNLIANAVDLIGMIVDSLGGMGGLLSMILVVATRLYAGPIAGMFNAARDTFISILPGGRQVLQDLRQETNQAYQEMLKFKGAATASSEAWGRLGQAQDIFLEKTRKLTPEQQKVAQLLMDQQRTLAENVIEQEKITKELQRQATFAGKSAPRQAMRAAGFGQDKEIEYAVGDEKPKTLSMTQAFSQYGTQVRQESALASAIQGSLGGLEQLTPDLISNEAVQRAKTQIVALQGAIKEAGTDLETAFGVKGAEAFKKLEEALNSGDFEQISEAAGKLEMGFTDLATDTEALRTALKQAFGNDSEKVEQALEEIRIAAEKAGNEEGELYNRTLLAKQGFDTFGQRLDELNVKLRNFGTTATSVASAMSGIASMGFAIYGVVNAINDENMSGWQKFLTILMSLSSVMFGFSQITRTVTDLLGKNTIAELLNAAAKKINARAKRDSAKASGEEAVADKIEQEQTDTSTRSEIANKIAKDANRKNGNGVNSSGGLKQDANGRWRRGNGQFASQNEITAFQKSQGGTGKSGAGKIGLWSKLTATKTGIGGKAGAAGTNFGGALGSAGLVAAGLLVAAASITAAVKWWNKDADKLKEAQEQLENATKRAEESQNRYNEMKDNISNYNDAKKGIDELTKGTLEFDEAVADANQKALKLLETYKNLSYEIDENGVIQIDEDSLKAAQAAEFRRMQAGQMEQSQANIRKIEAQNKADTTAFLRDKVKSDTGFGSKEDNAIIGGSIGAGAGLFAAIGTIVPGIGNLVGAGIGAAIGAAVGLIGGTIGAIADKHDADEQEYKAMEQLVKAYETGAGDNTPIDKLIDNLDGVGDGVKDALKENATETKLLAKQIAENNRLIALQKAQNLMTYMNNAGMSHLLESDYATEIAGIAAKEDTQVEDQRAEWWRLGIGHKFTDKNGNSEYMSDKEVREAYIKARYGEDAEYTSHWLTGQITGVTVNGQKVEGIDSDNKITFDEMRNYLADQSSTDQQAEAYKKYLEQFQNYQDQFETTFSFDSGDAAALTKRVAGAVAGTDTQSLLAMTAEEYNAVMAMLDSGVFGEYADEIKGVIKNWDEKTAATLRAIEIDKQANEIWAAGAQKTGVSARALEYFTEGLMENNGELADNKVGAAEASVSHAAFAKGIEKLNKVLKDNAEKIKPANKGTFEYAEAMAQVGEAVKEAFGVDVSVKFIEENIDKIRAVANGATESLDELRWAMADDYIANLTLKSDVKNKVEQLMDELKAQDPNIEIGGHFNNSEVIKGLNEALAVGDITTDQITQMFGAIGYTPNIQYKKVKNDSVTKGTIHLGGEDSPIKFSYANVVENETEIPYIVSDDAGTSDAPMVTGNSFTKNSTGDSLGSSLGSSITDSLNKNRKADKKAIKNLEDEKDLYRDINAELEDIERNLDSISKKKERAFGKDKLKYIQEEKAWLDQQIKSQKEYIEQIEKVKKAQYKDVSGYGFSFDADTGRIVNYGEVYDEMKKKYEAGRAQATELDDDDLRTWWDEWWETFTSNTDKYSNTVKLLEDEKIKLDDDIQRRLDADYEELEDTVEIKTMVSDSALKKLDFQLKLIEDDAYAAAEAIALMGQKAENYSNNFNANEQGIRDLLKYKGATDEAIEKFMNGDASGLFGLDLNQQDFDLLQQYQDDMIDSYDNLKESFDGIFEAIDGVFEKINEEFDELDATLEHSQSVLQSYQNIIELVGASTLGISDAMQLDIMDSQINVAQAQIKANKAQYDKNVEMLSEAREGLAAATTEEEKKKWEESIKFYEEQVRQSEQDWLSALENGLELSNQRREQAINIAIKEFLKETTGYSSMDELQRIYDQQKQLRDLYVTDYEKVYSLSKLSRQLEKSINDTSDINAKKQLLALEEKINKAKEAGVKMSSYELQNLEREYQIELAKIALEEAQNAKSMVRLRRNAEGGMSYVYTADQNALDQAQQKYEDAIYASQKANKEWLDSAQEGLMQATNTYLEQLAIINNSTTMSVEERNKAISELNEWYLGQQKFYSNQMDITLQNDSDLYERHISTMSGYYDKNEDNFVAMTTALIREDKRFLENFDDLVKAIGDGNNPNTLLGALQKAQNQWETDTKENFENAGFDIDSFRSNVANYLGEGTDEQPGVKKILDNVSSAIDTLKNKTDFTAAKNAATTYGTDVATAMEKAATQIGNVNTALSTLVTEWGKVDGLKDINKTININTNKIETQDTGGDNPPPNPNTNPNFSYIPYEEREQDTSKQKNYTKPITIQSFNSHNGDSGVVATDGRFYKSSEVSANGYSAGGKFNIGDTVYVVEGAGQDLRFVKQDGTDDAPGVGSQATFSLSSYNSMTKLKEDEIEYVQPNSKLNVWIPSSEWTRSDKNKMQIRKPYEWFIKSFDTGGYTGEWGPEGRLAMLHQKEIVLNAHDTENILSIVDMVRQMATQLDFNALTMARGLGNLVANTMIATPQTIDQNVTITAEFPNATNREEIKEAFGDLVNLAAQYASRK